MEDDENDHSIYFIEKGKVEIYTEQRINRQEKKIFSINTIEKGGYFGELGTVFSFLKNNFCLRVTIVFFIFIRIF